MTSEKPTLAETSTLLGHIQRRARGGGGLFPTPVTAAVHTSLGD